MRDVRALLILDNKLRRQTKIANAKHTHKKCNEWQRNISYGYENRRAKQTK